MSNKCFFFAGGGTGGHIYPAIAVAEQIAKLAPEAKVHFFCSSREIDSKILGQTGFEYTPLPAKGFSARPGKLIKFCTSFLESNRQAKEILAKTETAVVIGVGGFVAAPVCWAGRKLKRPVVLLNVDIVPGRANKVIARWAEQIFVQFEDTRQYFGRHKAKVNVVGCPLRDDFENPQTDKAIEQLGLDENKKILLVNGGSSGSASINNTVCSLLEKLDAFADDWQIVHLAGRANYEQVRKNYEDVKMRYRVVDYFNDIAGLLAASDLVIGRSGGVSVAEYAAASTPSICMPYPHHKDMHQYLNAGKLVEAEAAIIVDDLPDDADRAGWLWEELQELIKDDNKRQQMKENCAAVGKRGAALRIAERLLEITDS